MSQALAFAPCCPLQHTAFHTPRVTPLTHCRRRPRTSFAPKTRMQQVPEFFGSTDDADADEEPHYESLFADEDERSFWDDLDVSTALRPLSEEEKDKLRGKLPMRVANFLIRRADDAVRLREAKGDDSTFLGKILKELPPGVSDSEEEEDEYRDYVFETVAGPPTFRRRGTSLFGGGDGLPDADDTSNVDQDVIDVGQPKPKNVMSLFVGRVGGVDEQASRVGYSLLALFGVWVAVKIIFGLISFFVSFTFSFFAIFALSAGIFMVFFFLRF